MEENLAFCHCEHGLAAAHRFACSRKRIRVLWQLHTHFETTNKTTNNSTLLHVLHQAHCDAKVPVFVVRIDEKRQFYFALRFHALYAKKQSPCIAALH